MKNETRFDENGFAICDFCGKHSGSVSSSCDMECKAVVSYCPDCFYKAPKKLKELLDRKGD